MTGIAVGAAFLAGAAAGWSAALATALGVVAAVAVAGTKRLLSPAVAVIVAAILGAWRGEPPPSVAPLPWADAAIGANGLVADNPAATSRGQRFVLALAEVETRERRVETGGALCVWAPPHPEVRPGDRVALLGAVVPIEDQPPGLRPYFRQQGCAATSDARRLEVETHGSGWRPALATTARRLSRVVQDGAPGDAGVLLSGLVTGDDHALSPERRDAFLLTGTSHVTAVSGANVALLVSIWAILGSGIGWRRRVGWQLLTVAVVWAYALLAGAQPPALRAALVATGVVVASRVGRRADAVTLVVLAAAAMVAVEPAQLWRLSFQLSLAASLALAAVVPSLAPDRALGWIRAGLLVSVAAQIATLPVLLRVDPRLSLVEVPANLLIAPLIDVAFPLATLASLLGLLWAPLGEVLLLPAWLCARGVLAIVDTLSAVPEAPAFGNVALPARLVLTGVAALIVTTLSKEGRTWLGRLPEEARGGAPRIRVLGAGAVAGTVVVLLARWIG